MATKQIGSRVRMYVMAGKAAPAPPLGPALGQRGINIMQFCKDFNDKTKNIKPNVPIPIVINVKPDRCVAWRTFWRILFDIRKNMSAARIF